MSDLLEALTNSRRAEPKRINPRFSRKTKRVTVTVYIDEIPMEVLVSIESLEQGVIERVGRGRGVRHLLSQRFYRFLGRPGIYTRKRGLDRETNKALLLKHVRDSGSAGSQFTEFAQVLPALSRRQIQGLLQELRCEGLIVLKGAKKGAKWLPK